MTGYNYRTYFHLSELKHATPKDDELINLNLIILGSKDAHILLTSSTDPDINSPVYEIGKIFLVLKLMIKIFIQLVLKVLGAGANKFCEIRRKRKTEPMKNKQVAVLSPINPVPITIRITRCKKFLFFYQCFMCGC